jgi:hypothetical protein
LKYNEAMERIEVTDAMHDRVMRRVAEHEAAKRTRRRNRRVSAVAGLAAVLAIFVGVKMTQPAVVPGDQGALSSQNPSAVHDQQTFASAEELSAAVGFEVPEIVSLPFDKAESIEYSRIGAGLAQVVYSYGDSELTFRKAPGEDDISGDYNVYEKEETVDVDGAAVTLKGDGKGCCLAVWTDGEYSYSLMTNGNILESAMVQMVREAMGR